MFDALVVGAGPSGSSAAFDLARSGLKVAVLDRREFPRVKPCGGALTVKSLRALRFSISSVIQNVATDFIAGKALSTRTTFDSRHPVGALTVRKELDQFLLDKALEEGAEFHKIGAISGITIGNGRVEVQTSQEVFEGRFLIGADGANSTVRRLATNFRDFFWGFAVEAQVPRVDEREQWMEFDFGAICQGYGWVFPKATHYNVGVYTYSPNVKVTREDLFGYLENRFGNDRCEHVVGAPICFGGWNYKPETARVFLVGDAAGLCEPLLGEGIFYAIRSGQMAAVSITQEVKGMGTASEIYKRQVDWLKRDVNSAYRSASKFYANFDAGYALLTSRLARYCLMKGYAVGMPIGQIKDEYYWLPFRRVKPVPSLADWPQRKANWTLGGQETLARRGGAP